MKYSKRKSNEFEQNAACILFMCYYTRRISPRRIGEVCFEDLFERAKRICIYKYRRKSCLLKGYVLVVEERCVYSTEYSIRIWRNARDSNVLIWEIWVGEIATPFPAYQYFTHYDEDEEDQIRRKKKRCIELLRGCDCPLFELNYYSRNTCNNTLTEAKLECKYFCVRFRLTKVYTAYWHVAYRT